MAARTFRFLSWNLAMLERSAAAPITWDSSQTEAAVREIIIDLAPDLVLYQELPALVPFVETHSMMKANPRSHSGNLATLVRNDRMGLAPTVAAVGPTILTTFPDPGLTIANVHLPAGRSAWPDRLMHVSRVIEASPTDALVIVGDTNMRVDEADRLVDLGLASVKPPEPTWDSRRNRFREHMPEFSAYFTRWFSSPDITVDDVTVHTDPVEHDDRRFHVSDHYALSGVIVMPDQG